MWSVLRLGSSRASSQIVGLHKTSRINQLILQQVAFISHRDNRVNLPPRPAPFRYWQKKFNPFYFLFDNTLKRFDDNSKVIVVEGPIACGKEKFCKQLADELDMLYVPPKPFDEYYINPYGFDIRNLDPYVPESCQSRDLTKFLKEPKHLNTGAFQKLFYMLKYDRYTDGLCHVLNTGQGVVLQRSPWSDFIFVQAMVNAGYLSTDINSYFYHTYLRSLYHLLKPHVIIYLDVDVKTTLENIKKRGRPEEVNSPVLTEKYLTDIENNYKERFFKKMEEYCHILTYTWDNDEEDMYFVIEDIEKLSFNFKKSEWKMEDWNTDESEYWALKRKDYAPENRRRFMQCIHIERIDCPEMIISAHDAERFDRYKDFIPGYSHEIGYDPDLDGNLLWKYKEYSPEDILRRRGALPKTGHTFSRQIYAD